MEISSIIGTVLVLAGAAAAYCLPAGVAYQRRHHNRQAILALNLVAGWTLIGWIACLIWALTRPPTAAA